MKYDIFISYSRHDSEIVKKFYGLFRSWGYSVWIDKDGIESGDAFVSVIVKAIMESKAVVFFSSKSSNASSWTIKEIALAVEEKKKIIPVKLDSVKFNDSIRFQLIDLDYIDYQADKSDAENRLQKALEAELGKKENISADDSGHIKPQKRRKWWFLFAAIAFITALAGVALFTNRGSADANQSSIDTVTQKICKHILLKELQECSGDYGQVIVMECSTGKVRAMVELTKREGINELDSSICYFYEEGDSFNYQDASGLMNFVSVLACLETGRIDTSTVVDTGCGVQNVRGETIMDHNWHYGGYGELNVKKAVELQSTIACCKLVDQLFKGNTLDFYKKIRDMGYGLPDTISSLPVRPVKFQYPDSPYSWIGYNHKIAPIQILTFFNSIANNGTVMQPQFKENEEPRVLKEKNMNDKVLHLAKVILRKCVIEGLSYNAESEEFPIAGIGNRAVIQTSEDGVDLYSMQFCTFFPADNPKYSLIVTINKRGQPASSGRMCAPVAKDIAEIIYYNKNK